MFSFGNNHPIVTRGSRVSRSPPHHTPPRFSQSSWYKILFKMTRTRKAVELIQKSLRHRSNQHQGQYDQPVKPRGL